MFKINKKNSIQSELDTYKCCNIYKYFADVTVVGGDVFKIGEEYNYTSLSFRDWVEALSRGRTTMTDCGVVLNTGNIIGFKIRDKHTIKDFHYKYSLEALTYFPEGLIKSQTQKYNELVAKLDSL